METKGGVREALQQSRPNGVDMEVYLAGCVERKWYPLRTGIPDHPCCTWGRSMIADSIMRSEVSSGRDVMRQGSRLT